MRNADSAVFCLQRTMAPLCPVQLKWEAITADSWELVSFVFTPRSIKKIPVYSQYSMQVVGCFDA